jgi:hypothetical protein
MDRRHTQRRESIDHQKDKEAQNKNRTQQTTKNKRRTVSCGVAKFGKKEEEDLCKTDNNCCLWFVTAAANEFELPLIQQQQQQQQQRTTTYEHACSEENQLMRE